MSHPGDEPQTPNEPRTDEPASAPSSVSPAPSNPWSSAPASPEPPAYPPQPTPAAPSYTPEPAAVAPSYTPEPAPSQPTYAPAPPTYPAAPTPVATTSVTPPTPVVPSYPAAQPAYPAAQPAYPVPSPPPAVNVPAADQAQPTTAVTPYIQTGGPTQAMVPTGPVPALPVPYPAPPTFDPTMAQQFSGPPISAYPYPYGLPSALPAPKPRSGRTVLVLSIIVALLVGATAVMTTLFLLQKHETSKANTQINALAGQVGSLTTTKDGLQRDLDKARNDLKDAQDSAEQTNEQKQILVDCLKGLNDAGIALDQNGNKITPQIQKMIDDANAKCRKASQFL